MGVGRASRVATLTDPALDEVNTVGHSVKVKHFGAADTKVGLDGDPSARGETGFEVGADVVGAQCMECPDGHGDEIGLHRQRKRRWNLTAQLHEVRLNRSEVVRYDSVTYAAILDEQIDIDFRSSEILFDQHPGIRPEMGDRIRGQRGGIISHLGSQFRMIVHAANEYAPGAVGGLQHYWESHAGPSHGAKHIRITGVAVSKTRRR